MIQYTYTSSGVKISQQLFEEGGEGTRRDYAGAFVYVDDALAWVNTPHGRFVHHDDGWKKEFHLRDHLGNTRVVLQQDQQDQQGQLASIQESHYYPFGMLIPSLTHNHGTGALRQNRYLYNGKELQDDFGLGWYDYGARFYDAQIGRFHALDPRAETYSFQSPFVYAANNPAMYIDYKGEFPLLLIPAIPFAIKGTVIATAAIKATVITAAAATTTYVAYKAGEGIREGYREQQKRERASQSETSQIKQKHAKSVNNNVGKPTPDGSNTPKGGGNTIGGIVVATGLAAVIAQEVIESTGGNNQNSSNENQSNGSTVTTISQGSTTSESTTEAETNFTFTPPTYTAPVDNTRVSTPIPLRIDENN